MMVAYILYVPVDKQGIVSLTAFLFKKVAWHASWHLPQKTICIASL